MSTFFAEHWFAISCLAAAAGFGVASILLHNRDGEWPWTCYLAALIFASYSAGTFSILPASWFGPMLTTIGVFGFATVIIAVFLSGAWSPARGHGMTVVLFFGLGEWTGAAVAEGLRLAGLFLLSLRTHEPWWLILLSAIPVLLWVSYQNLVTLGETRRWTVLALRSSLIALVALALAEAYGRTPNEGVTVIFIWDRSLSIPKQLDGHIDHREERAIRFINQAVALRGPDHANDRVGLVVFGKHAHLELPPGRVKTLNFKEVRSQVDNTYTDIEAGMKLALASLPSDSGGRLVIISDFNENRGRAIDQARLAKQNGIEVDVLPILEGRSAQNEILVERIEAPRLTEKGAQLPVRVVLRSFHPQVVVARLEVRKIFFDPQRDLRDELARNTTIVKLRQGLQIFSLQETAAKEETAFAYEAKITPLAVETPDGARVHNELPGDRIENNVARVVVMARGQRSVLILEDRPEKMENVVTHQLLVDRLRASHAGMKVDVMTPHQLRTITKGDTKALAIVLTKYDAIFLANIPAEFLDEDEQKVIRSHVHDQGAGLVMIGGHQSFGAGGWQNTEIEKALPVNMDLKSMKVEGKSGLVLIMHASEMQDGNAWQRKIAQLAVEKLSPMDMVGLIHYDHGFEGGKPGHRYHIPFQEVGPNRRRLVGLVATMQPGDMPDVDPAFQLAYKQLTNRDYGLGTKHIILISDGDHWDASAGMMNRLRTAGITCTTVCITSHGRDEVRKMAAVAKAAAPGGRAYHVKDLNELPAIYIKETRLISQSFVHEKPFQPFVMGMREGPTEGLGGKLPLLHGLVRTTPKESSLVKVLIESEPIGEHKFPVLAAWQYGLGKSVAFTSDARTIPGAKPYWDRDWANAPIYAKFWDQTVNWVLRPKETGENLFLTTEHKDGKIRIIIHARDADKTPLTDVDLKAGVTSPAFKVKDDRKSALKFEQKNAGVYEAEVPADEVGAYFIHVQAKWKKISKDKDGKEVVEEQVGSVRAGVSVPYSPEFIDTEGNADLAEQIRKMTDGRAYRDDADFLDKVARAGDVFRSTPRTHASLQPLWPWLVFAAAWCLLFDVAVRRIAIQPEVVWVSAVTYWNKLRGQADTDDSSSETIERLKSRKAEATESIDKKKAATKFEAREGEAPAEPPAPSPTMTASEPTEQPKAPPPQKTEEPEEDYATRLMRAKKKAMEEREKS